MYLRKRLNTIHYIYHKKERALQARYAVAIVLLRRGTLQTTCNGLTALFKIFTLFALFVKKYF